VLLVTAAMLARNAAPGEMRFEREACSANRSAPRRRRKRCPLSAQRYSGQRIGAAQKLGWRRWSDDISGNEMRGLTFELTGPERQGGLARLATMYRMVPTGPRRPAVEGPVERRVRQASATVAREPQHEAVEWDCSPDALLSQRPRWLRGEAPRATKPRMGLAEYCFASGACPEKMLAEANGDGAGRSRDFAAHGRARGGGVRMAVDSHA